MGLDLVLAIIVGLSLFVLVGALGVGVIKEGIKNRSVLYILFGAFLVILSLCVIIGIVGYGIFPQYFSVTRG